nr:hypothetical protein [Streptomyces niveus]
MNRHKNLRDSHQRGTGLHHAGPAVAHIHNLALTAAWSGSAKSQTD